MTFLYFFHNSYVVIIVSFLTQGHYYSYYTCTCYTECCGVGVYTSNVFTCSQRRRRGKRARKVYTVISQQLLSLSGGQLSSLQPRPTVVHDSHFCWHTRSCLHPHQFAPSWLRTVRGSFLSSAAPAALWLAPHRHLSVALSGTAQQHESSQEQE